MSRRDAARDTPGRLRRWVVGLALIASVVTRHAAQADDWPQWLGPQRDGVWRETGIIEKFPSDGPAVRWRTPIGAGYAGPAVAGDRVFLTDRMLSEGARNPTGQAVFQRGTIPGVERVLCLNDADGQVVWQHEYECPYTISYPSGPRSTPVVHNGKVYTLGAEGNLFCFDAEDGNIAWSRELKKDYHVEAPMWGFSSQPLIDGRKLIVLVGGKGTTVVAFDTDTGKEIWHAISAKEPGYAPPMIFQAGGRRQLIVWDPEAIHSLDPETGKEYWSQPFAVKAGLTIPTPRKDGDYLFFTSFYNGPIMLRLDPQKPGATVLWQGTSQSERKTDKLHAIICTPFIEKGYIYGVCSYGQLRCLKEETGERIWESLAATGATGSQNDRWANAFIVKQGDRFFLPNEKGDLIIARLTPRGYDEISRTHLLEPTSGAMGRDVVWSHPAFAHRSVYARNDKEIVCVSLAAQAAGE